MAERPDDRGFPADDELPVAYPHDPTSPSKRIPYPDVPPPLNAPGRPAGAVENPAGAVENPAGADENPAGAAPRQRRTVVIGESAAPPGTGLEYSSDYTSLTDRIVASGATRRTPSGGSAQARVPLGADDPTSGTVGLKSRAGDVADPIDGSSGPADGTSRPADGTSRIVVISDDDGLPDASYTVADARSPDAPGGPRVHPRLRARRLAVRRQAGRRRIYWSAIAGGALFLGVLTIGILSTPLFAVNKIRLSGIVYTDQEQIAEITKSIRGKPILTADLNSVRSRLEDLPWVKYASVTMDFPHTVVIQIAERTPVAAFLGEDNKWRVIDVEGRVIDVLAGRPVDYASIYGAGPLLDRGASSLEFAKVAQLVTAMPPQLIPSVRHFEVDQQFNVSLTLRINKKGDTLVDLCSAESLDIRQMVALTAFLKTKVDPKATPPGRITACKPDLVTTSDS